MTLSKGRLAAWLAVGVLSGAAIVATPKLVSADTQDSTEARLQRIEARQEIENLFAAYGATLDHHDFEGFGRLFAEDATYGGGPNPTRGRAAIQAQLEKQLTSNPMHLPGPDFHLYFNPSIKVMGDKAVATSKGAYVVPDAANNGVRLVFFVQYDDTFVKREGHWMFATRALSSGAPPAQTPASKQD